jgi:hypothetical protein
MVRPKLRGPAPARPSPVAGRDRGYYPLLLLYFTKA